MADNKKMSVEDILKACRTADGGEGTADTAAEPVSDAPAAESAAAETKAAPKAAPKALRVRRRTVTPEVTIEVVIACADAGHDLLVGSNAHSAFVTCLVCRHHLSWTRAATVPLFALRKRTCRCLPAPRKKSCRCSSPAGSQAKS